MTISAPIPLTPEGRDIDSSEGRDVDSPEGRDVDSPEGRDVDSPEDRDVDSQRSGTHVQGTCGRTRGKEPKNHLFEPRFGLPRKTQTNC